MYLVLPPGYAQIPFFLPQFLKSLFRGLVAWDEYSSTQQSRQPTVATVVTRIPGLVREHRADKANDDIGNSARTKGCGLKEFLERFLLYYWLNYLFTVSIGYLPL